MLPDESARKFNPLWPEFYNMTILNTHISYNNTQVTRKWQKISMVIFVFKSWNEYTKYSDQGIQMKYGSKHLSSNGANITYILFHSI